MVLLLLCNCNLLVIPGTTVEVFTDEGDTLTGIYYQDYQMKQDFAKFPDVILMDATYKVNNFLMPLYLMLVVDGNGESQVVMTCLTVLETSEAITRMVNCFKRHNPAWEKVRFAMTDKDMVERTVLRTEMPQVKLGLCLFHTLRTFKREVTTSKLGITEEERDSSLQILQSLAYAKSPDEYENLHRKLLNEAPRSVLDYFTKNWHPLKEEWVHCFKSYNYNLGEMTTNRVESWNSRIKEVCTSYSTLFKFYQDFCKLIKTLRNERLHKLVDSQTRLVPHDHDDQELRDYKAICTPYSYLMVHAEHKLLQKVSLENLDRNNTSINSCNCLTHVSKLIPCRHILAKRKMENLPLFDKNLIAERWTKEYIMSSIEEVHNTYNSDHDHEEESMPAALVTKSAPIQTSVKLSEIQKYRLAHTTLQRLCTILSHQGTVEFRKNLELLQELYTMWMERKEVVLVEVLKQTGIFFMMKLYCKC